MIPDGSSVSVLSAANSPIPIPRMMARSPANRDGRPAVLATCTRPNTSGIVATPKNTICSGLMIASRGPTEAGRDHWDDVDAYSDSDCESYNLLLIGHGHYS